jgi:hypothetical protein
VKFSAKDFSLSRQLQLITSLRGSSLVKSLKTTTVWGIISVPVIRQSQSDDGDRRSLEHTKLRPNWQGRQGWQSCGDCKVGKFVFYKATESMNDRQLCLVKLWLKETRSDLVINSVYWRMNRKLLKSSSYSQSSTIHFILYQKCHQNIFLFKSETITLLSICSW